MPVGRVYELGCFFVRRPGRGNEEHLREAEPFSKLFCGAEMTDVYGVERSSEDA
jgi:hypothetical protein